MYFVLSIIIYIVNCVVSGEIYTTGKKFTLPPGVTGVTNSTSDSHRFVSGFIVSVTVSICRE